MSFVPAATVERLNSALNKALQKREVREKLGQLGLEIVGGTSQQFASLITTESKKWADVARKASIRAD